MVKSLEEFGKQKHNKDGRHGVCKLCTRASNRARYRERIKDPEWRREYRNRHFKQRYKITHDDYDRMFEEQGGVCAVCFEPPDESLGEYGRLQVDHDHETGEARGLLCRGCNTGFGLLEAVWEQACAYLGFS